MTTTPATPAYVWRIKPSQRPDAITTCAADYLEHEKARHYSLRTVQTHDYWLARFIDFCDERGVTSIHDVTRPVVVRFQRFLFYYRKKNGQPLGYCSQRGALGTVRGMFRYLTRAGIIFANPSADLEMPKRMQQMLPKHTLSVDEVERIFAAIDVDNAMALRDRAILEVLYSTGVRRTELCCLKVFDVDHDRGVIVVRQGKGRKDRVVPIGDRALAWVRKYLDDDRPRFAIEPDDGWLFLNEDGEAVAPGWLSRLTRVHIDNAAIGKTGSCHIFRHTMATLMLDAGADLRVIQEILGHASLETTQVYTRVSVQRLKNAHTLAHPAKLERAATTTPKPTPEQADLLAALDGDDEVDDA